MKIKFLLTFFILMSMFGFSQEFDGIKIEGSKSVFIKAMAAKGYTIKSDQDYAVTFKGNPSHSDLELIALFSRDSKLTWKLAVFLPEQTTWDNLQSQFDRYLKLLTEKYGDPANTYKFFSEPYKDGDGYEMTAVAVEKCTYAAFWNSPQIILQISKTKQIRIDYENPTNSAIAQKEKEDADKKTF